jgi:hypothetical protein
MSTKITRGARRHLLVTTERLRRRQKFGAFDSTDDVPRYVLTMRDNVSPAARKAAQGLAHLIGPGAMTAEDWASPVAASYLKRAP